MNSAGAKNPSLRGLPAGTLPLVASHLTGRGYKTSNNPVISLRSTGTGPAHRRELLAVSLCDNTRTNPRVRVSILPYYTSCLLQCMQFQFQHPYINLNDQSHARSAWAKGDASCSHNNVVCRNLCSSPVCAGRPGQPPEAPEERSSDIPDN